MLVHHDGRDYNVARSEAAAKARDLMTAKIEGGKQSARKLIEYAHSMSPVDSVVKARAFEFAPIVEVDEKTNALVSATAPRVVIAGSEHAIHRHAFNQMAQKMGVPFDYISKRAAGEQWERDLAAQIMNEHFHKDEPNSKYLVRKVGDRGEVRGFLSDRYRRLDSRPLLDAFAESCNKVGAIPVEGVVSDLRLSLKAFLPMVFEPVPNEVMCLGVEWGNSDYGAAKHTVRAFIWRLWCTNMATMEDALAQVHLGGRLAEDIAFSQRTYALDTQTSVSALKDIVAGLLGPAKVNTLLETIKACNEKEVDWKNVKTKLAKKLLKEELKLVEDAYNSEDVINLPAGKTAWRVSNALSWIAGKTDDNDRRLELQRFAGEVVNGKADTALEAA